MKGTTLLRILLGGIVAGVALYYTIEATVYFITSHSTADSFTRVSPWILFTFRVIPGLTFVLLYWRVGAILKSKSWLTKGLIVGVMFSLLNETLVPSNLYDFVTQGYYAATIETILSILLINIVMGYLLVSVVPVHPIGDNK